jgi:hypothetical protein
MGLKSRHLLSCGRQFFQGAFLGREVNLEVDMRHFYREASPDMRGGSVGTCLKCFDQSGSRACIAGRLRIIRY